jgi:hypothetical protein
LLYLVCTSFRDMINLNTFPSTTSSEPVKILGVDLITVNRVSSSTRWCPSSPLLLDFLHLLVMKVEKSNFLVWCQVNSIRQINN